jgi:hypothetical protein
MALQQRTNESVPPELVSVAGVDNALADIPSRITEYWKPPPHDSNPERAPSDDEFLTFFNTTFPLPQTKSWRVVTPDPVTLSNVISTLRGKRLPLQQWMTPLGLHAGDGGCSTQPNVDATPSFATAASPSNNKLSWDLPPGFALGSTGETSKLAPRQLKKPSVRWRKPTCWLATPTPAARMD